MRHVYWVIPDRLAGRPGPEKFPWDVRELAARGIGAVISLCGPIDSSELRRAGVRHLPLYQPMILLESEDQRERFLAVMPAVLSLLEACERENKALLIHCHHGCDRTGTVLACCLMARDKLSASEALERVRAVNPRALTAYGYAEAVATYERLLREGNGLAAVDG